MCAYLRTRYRNGMFGLIILQCRLYHAGLGTINKAHLRSTNHTLVNIASTKCGTLLIDYGLPLIVKKKILELLTS
jgi:hypothetical protein